MASEKKYTIKEGVSITEEVVAIIAGLAATEVEGVESLSGNLKSELIEKAGIVKLSKGVHVEELEDNALSLKIAMNITYGHDIMEVSEHVQEKVKMAIENMTGLTVKDVNIHISSVTMEA